MRLRRKMHNGIRVAGEQISGSANIRFVRYIALKKNVMRVALNIS